MKRSGSGIGGGTRQLLTKKPTEPLQKQNTAEYGADIDVGEYADSPKPDEQDDGSAGEYGMGPIEPMSPVKDTENNTNE